MRKILVVAVREYLASVRTKAFVISLVIMPIMMGGSLVFQWLLRDYRDVQKKTYAVVDRTPGERLWAAVEKAVEGYNATVKDPDTGKLVNPPFEVKREPPAAATEAAIGAQRANLSERVRRGELFGFLEIGPAVLEPAAAEDDDKNDYNPHAIRYQSNRPTNEVFPRLVQKPLDEAIAASRYDRAKTKDHLRASLAEVQAIVRPVPVKARGLSTRNAEGRVEYDKEQVRFASVLVPLGLMMLMFMVIMMGATPQMQGVVEEKMQRIAEVLLGSVRPFDLMLGKLLGMTAVSLTITAVYLGGGYWAAHHYGFDKLIPGSLLAWFVLFQALASFMYGSLFIAVGAACTDMKETQNLLWPVMLLAVAPMFVLGNVLQEPNSAVATGLSFFPFATPMLMIVRLSVPPGIAVWQPLVGALIVLATTLVCVWAAGRVFRVGILLQGKGASLKEMGRWVFRG
jgi:ABC-2 type transport system permease protein